MAKNDTEQRLAAMNEPESKNCLREIVAVFAENVHPDDALDIFLGRIVTESIRILDAYGLNPEAELE